MLLYLIFAYAFQIISCVAAVLLGGREERLIGWVFVANILASKAAYSNQWQEPEYLLLGVDVAFLVFLLWRSIVTDRWWVLWFTAFQVLVVIIHVASVVDPTVRPRSFSFGFIIWSWMEQLAILIGALTAWHSRRRVQPHVAR
jgi:hypothetical protein